MLACTKQRVCAASLLELPLGACSCGNGPAVCTGDLDRAQRAGCGRPSVCSEGGPVLGTVSDRLFSLILHQCQLIQGVSSDRRVFINLCETCITVIVWLRLPSVFLLFRAVTVCIMFFRIISWVLPFLLLNRSSWRFTKNFKGRGKKKEWAEGWWWWWLVWWWCCVVLCCGVVMCVCVLRNKFCIKGAYTARTLSVRSRVRRSS